MKNILQYITIKRGNSYHIQHADSFDFPTVFLTFFDESVSKQAGHDAFYLVPALSHLGGRDRRTAKSRPVQTAYCCLKYIFGRVKATGEVTQWWRTRTSLPGNLGLIPSTSHVFATPAPGNLMLSSGILGHCTHVIHRHTCRQNVFLPCMLAT